MSYEQRIPSRKGPIKTAKNIGFVRRLSRIHRDDSLTSTDDAVVHRPEFEIGRDARIDSHIHKAASRTGGEKASTCIGIRHRQYPGFAEALPQAFIIPKEEH